MEDETKARKLDGCPKQLQMIKQLGVLRHLNSQRKLIKTTCTGSSSFDLKVARSFPSSTSSNSYQETWKHVNINKQARKI
jgi:hypothetical protein